MHIICTLHTSEVGVDVFQDFKNVENVAFLLPWTLSVYLKYHCAGCSAQTVCVWIFAKIINSTIGGPEWANIWGILGRITTLVKQVRRSEIRLNDTKLN